MKHAVRSMTIFGFMSLNGRDVVMASQQAKAIDMVSFLEAVRSANGRMFSVRARIRIMS